MYRSSILLGVYLIGTIAALLLLISHFTDPGSEVWFWYGLVLTVLNGYFLVREIDKPRRVK